MYIVSFSPYIITNVFKNLRYIGFPRVFLNVAQTILLRCLSLFNLLFFEIKYLVVVMTVLIFTNLILDMIKLGLPEPRTQYLYLLLPDEFVDSLDALLHCLRLHLQHSLLQIVLVCQIRPLVRQIGDQLQTLVQVDRTSYSWGLVGREWGRRDIGRFAARTVGLAV